MSCARRALAACIATTLPACTAPVRMPANVRIGTVARVSPAPASPSAPPRILAIAFSSNDLRRGTDWSGVVVTTTNVASVEVRTNLFSIDVPRTTYGKFAFRAHVLDVPPIFVRPYRLRVIARNAAAAETEEDLPFRIR